MPHPDPIQRDAGRMARVAQGDRASFRAIWDQDYDRAFRVAAGILLDRAEAREVVQECFVDLWQLAPRWTPQATVAAWLTKTATRKALRRRQIFWRLFDAELLPSWRPAAPDLAVAGVQAGERLQAALAQLSPKRRAVVTLHLDQGLAPAQIADALGISPAAARTTLHRARAQLAQALE